MNDVQEKIAQLQVKGWTLAALADELGITVNAIEKWKAGDRYPRNSKPVLDALDRLGRRKQVPKQRRYNKGREVVMPDNSITQFEDGDTLDNAVPLPLYVARRWDFPLQYHVVDDQEYFSISDWIMGLTGQSSREAKDTWGNMRGRNQTQGVVSKRLSYRMSNGRTAQSNFTNDEGLYKIALMLRVIKERPMLQAIKDFLAKAGVFVDAARRDPEGASERLAIARRTRALSSGKSEEWVATREVGVVTRKQFVSQIYALVKDKKQFGVIIGSLTNDVYRGTFHDDVRGLRNRLGISSKENPRDHFSRIALSYTAIAEEAIRINLSQYDDNDFVPVPVMRDIVHALSATIGVQADTIANALQIDIITGRSALPSGNC